MKILRIAAQVLGFAACAAVAICLLTDGNDDLFLPLGLCLGVAANVLGVLSVRRSKGGKETER